MSDSLPASMRKLLVVLFAIAALPAVAFKGGRWEQQVEYSRDGVSWQAMGPLHARCGPAISRADWERNLRQQLSHEGCDASGVRLRGDSVDGVLRCPQATLTVNGQVNDAGYRVQGLADTEVRANGQAMGRAKIHYRQTGRHVGACQGDEQGGEVAQ